MLEHPDRGRRPAALLLVALVAACGGQVDSASLDRTTAVESDDAAQSSPNAPEPSTPAESPSTGPSAPAGDERLPPAVAQLLPGRLLGLEQAELEVVLGPQQQWPDWLVIDEWIACPGEARRYAGYVTVTDESDTEWVVANLTECPAVNADGPGPARPFDVAGAQRLVHAVQSISTRGAHVQAYGAEPWPQWFAVEFQECPDGDRVRSVDVEAIDGSVVGASPTAPCNGLPGS